MKRFEIMTLFPELVERVLGESIIGRAQASGAICVKVWNIRDYSKVKHRRVDDTPYGGGRGMLMMAPPIYDCYCAILEDEPVDDMSKVRRVYMSPQGRVLNQSIASEYAREYDRYIILCGHYEGVDRRIIDEIIDEELSIGDFVLTGGEIPACIFVDCVARLCDGVLADPECFAKESFSDGLLEYPQYTRPYEFHGVRVPDVLLSGHHAKIDGWRDEMARAETEKKRPDLISAEKGGDKA